VTQCVIGEGFGLRVARLVIFEENIRRFRYAPDAFVTAILGVIESALELQAPFLLGFRSDGLASRLARFLNMAAGKTEVIPPNALLLRFAGCLVDVGWTINGHFTPPKFP